MTAYDELWTSHWVDQQRYGPTSRHNRRVLAKLLDPLAFESILDVGCGEGSNLAFLQTRYAPSRSAGTDVSAVAVDRARLACPSATFHVGPLEALDERFDLVTCLDVLEHVEDDVGLLGGIAAVTRGWALCSTVQGRMRESERQIGHLRNYRGGELEDKMRAAGFAIHGVVEWGFPFYSPLMRSLVGSTGSESVAAGHYGPAKRLACEALHALFFLNSWRRGDRLFVLGERSAGVTK